MAAKSLKMTVTTPSDRELLITRVFDAPRQLVFDAFTKPELIRRWVLGPPGWTMPVCEFEAKVGGRFRYEWRNEDGRGMGMGGSIREFNPPARMVHTELFDEDWTGGETIVATLFTEKGGKTTMAMTVLYASQKARDGARMTGMEDGMEHSFHLLDEVLAGQE